MHEQNKHVFMRAAMCAWRWLSPDAWQRTLARIAAVALVVAAGGMVFIMLGLTPIAASDGHWRITQRFLGFTMTQTVRMQSLGIRAPPLDDPALVLKGAGHYAGSCAACHGAPGQPRAMEVRQMAPEPPHLAASPSEPSDWTSPQLFWIVKHGIKYSAMPAWPSQQRDDEVWAMVAFLQRLPDMDAAQYQALAYGPVAPLGPTSGEGVHLSALLEPALSTLDNCARCHGADGLGRGHGAFPILAGQRETYLLASLQAYASGARHSGVMQPIAAGLGKAQMLALATHYAGLESPLSAGADVVSPAPVMSGDVIPAGGAARALPEHIAARARGAELAADGAGLRRIPACRHCHGPDATARNPFYPRIAGQYADYLRLQLELFQQERRGGTRYQQLMHRAASELSDQEIRDVAAYYASARTGFPPQASP